jgi:HSP20 family molecular chaperone IbpA
MSDKGTANWKSGGAFGTCDEEQQTGEIYGGRGASPRRGPLSETQGYSGGYAGERPSPFGREDDDFYADEEGGTLDLLKDRWYLVLGALAVLVVLVIVAGRVFGGGDPPAAPESSRQQAPPVEKAQGTQKGVSDVGEAEDTGIVVEPGTQDEDGTITLTAGELAWRGEVEETDEGEVLTLEGPTAAQFKRGFELPNGSMTSGVFAVAQPGEPVVHATFHRAEQGEEEVTTGTYYAMDEDVVLSRGTYVDDRDGDTVTRTYTEQPGETEESVYRVTFTAPQDAPVPFLPGWRAPSTDVLGAISGGA